MSRGSIGWLRPGMRIKRWSGLAVLAILFGMLGIAFLNHGQAVDMLGPANRLLHWISLHGGLSLVEGDGGTWLGLLFVLLSASIMALAATRLVQSISSAINPEGAPGSL